MKFEQSKEFMTKLFSQIDCLQLPKTKSLLSAFLLVALVTLLTVPVQAAPHGGGHPPTLSAFCFQGLISQWRKAMALT